MLNLTAVGELSLCQNYARLELNMSIAPDAEQLRTEWLNRLDDLVGTIQSWASSLDWSTRKIEVSLQDSELGKYKAPALLLQFESVRIILEPIARSAPGVEGVVDLYLMPAFDDIASLYFTGGEWSVHYMFAGTPTVGDMREAPAKPLSRDTLAEVLSEMLANAHS